MNLFHRILEAQAVVRTKSGVYAQRDLYRRGDELFVSQGGGFIRVERKLGTGDELGTSSPTTTVVGYDIGELRLVPGAMGRLMLHG